MTHKYTNNANIRTNDARRSLDKKIKDRNKTRNLFDESRLFRKNFVNVIFKYTLKPVKNVADTAIAYSNIKGS